MTVCPGRCQLCPSDPARSRRADSPATENPLDLRLGSGFYGAFIRALDAELERSRSESVDLGDTREKAILLSVTQAPLREAEDALDELAELARTADVVVLDRIMQRSRKMNPRSLMGEGKLKEVVISALHQAAQPCWCSTRI